MRRLGSFAALIWFCVIRLGSDASDYRSTSCVAIKQGIGGVE